MVEVTRAEFIIADDYHEAEKFRRGHGGKYDRETAMMTAAFARVRREGRLAAEQRIVEWLREEALASRDGEVVADLAGQIETGAHRE